ncbi:TPA: nicotinate-nucleotide adenylyltransferase [Legionella feeleii]
MHNLIIYGGTFDPIHNGHIKTAINVQNHFNFEQFIFLPCKIPVLKKEAAATAKQRIDMLELALKNLDQNFEINLSEINRESPSYMVHTLQNFRLELGGKLPITLLLGTDSFNQLPQWHNWQQLLTLANLLVIKRCGSDKVVMPEKIKKLLEQHETFDSKTLMKSPHGLIYFYDAGSFNISSSQIRKLLSEGKDLSTYLPEEVANYIKENQLYL